MNQQPRHFNSFQSKAPAMTMGKYTAKTFGWMCLGLMVTFISAFLLAISGMALMFFSTGISFGLAIAQIAVVIFLSARIDKLSEGAARALFLTYSLLTGITFSGLFYGYGFDNVIGVFLLTSVYFGALAAFGYFTDIDLSKLGTLFMSGLVFLIIAGLVLLFVNIPFLDTAVCLIGIALFLGMTAYDVQKMRNYYDMYSHDTQTLNKVSIICALELYLDFINLFIYLLRFIARNNND